jgi:uroporphyrinogen-III synthase
MRLLVTRPQPDADQLAAELTARGHSSLIAPVLEITHLGTAIDLDGVQAILVTSRNGVRTLSAMTDRRDIPLLAVGYGTAGEAEASGFSTLAASGDVAALGALVRATLRSDAGKLLWITGKNVRGDLRADLCSAGYHILRHVAYDARAVDSVPPDCAAALERHEIDGALFFSPRTAQTFVRILTMAGLDRATESVTAFCLSPAVAAAVADLPWRGIETSGRTDRVTLLDLVDQKDAMTKSGR